MRRPDHDRLQQTWTVHPAEGPSERAPAAGRRRSVGVQNRNPDNGPRSGRHAARASCTLRFLRRALARTHQRPSQRTVQRRRVLRLAFLTPSAPVSSPREIRTPNGLSIAAAARPWVLALPGSCRSPCVHERLSTRSGGRPCPPALPSRARTAVCAHDTVGVQRALLAPPTPKSTKPAASCETRAQAGRTPPGLGVQNRNPDNGPRSGRHAARASCTLRFLRRARAGTHQRTSQRTVQRRRVLRLAFLTPNAPVSGPR